LFVGWVTLLYEYYYCSNLYFLGMIAISSGWS
jgi:hypothetical protein